MGIRFPLMSMRECKWKKLLIDSSKNVQITLDFNLTHIFFSLHHSFCSCDDDDTSSGDTLNFSWLLDVAKSARQLLMLMELANFPCGKLYRDEKKCWVEKLKHFNEPYECGEIKCYGLQLSSSELHNKRFYCTSRSRCCWQRPHTWIRWNKWAGACREL